MGASRYSLLGDHVQYSKTPSAMVLGKAVET